jgi:hypothetical protein
MGHESHIRMRINAMQLIFKDGMIVLVDYVFSREDDELFLSTDRPKWMVALMPFGRWDGP